VNKVVIGIIVVVLLAGAFFAGKLLDSQDSEEQSKGEVVSATEQYFAMERFIISINDENLTRYLVLDLSLAIPADGQSSITAETYAPLLRNELVKRFVNLDRDHVKSEFTDIEQMQKTLLEKFNSVLKTKSDLELSNVIITNVFIQ
jgi:flagellar FliL protein